MQKNKTVKIVEKVLDEHKAEDIKVYDVKEKTPFADYYILATAGSERQLNAFVEILQNELEKNKIKIGHVEGKADSHWVLIDAHDVIINIFTEDERNRVQLDDLLK